MLETLALKQIVAASVLDRPGEVKELKLRSGRQAFVERLQQLVAPATFSATPAHGAVKAQPSPSQSSLPADPAAAFALLASRQLDGDLVRCEERYPQAGSLSVVVVIVERDSANSREKLEALHSDLFGPGKIDPLAPVQLEVIDRQTDETIQRLIAAGLITKTTRASRPLFPAEENAEFSKLSAEEQAKAKAHRERAGRKLKMARVLGNTGFGEEARPALLDAIHAFGCALAVERRLPEQPYVKETLQPALSHCWAGALPILKTFVEDPTANWKPAAEQLGKL
jgi:hypothetical protein